MVKEKGRSSIWRNLIRRRWLILGTIAFLLVILIVLLWFLFRERPRIVKPFRAEQCLACHRLEKGKYVHSPYGNVYCTSCHTPHKLGEKSKLVAPLKELCLSCHPSIGKQLGMKFVHSPVEIGKCLDCHKPHVSDYRALLKKSTDEICVMCHRVAEELAMKDTHLPFERKQCLSCHVAHGSEFERGLIKNQRVLCVMCHPDVGRDISLDYVHGPIEKDRCTDCHGAHATNYAFQLTEERPRFCYSCHSDIEILFAKASHHPSDASFHCSNCHEPHGTRYRYLLPASGPDFCYLCHEEFRANYRQCAHNYVTLERETGSCLNCHLVHGADYSPLLPQMPLPLCKSCHPLSPRRSEDHPYGEPYVDELKGRTLTCTSSCHNPHGTGFRDMLTSLPDGLCLQCHPASELP